MAKLLGPDFISLQVRNFSASRAFYTELLGLPVDSRFDAPDFVLFDTSSIPFALSAAKVNLDELPQPGLGVALWLDCDNVNELHATLNAAGATIITPPFDGDLGVPSSLQTPMGTGLQSTKIPGIGFPWVADIMARKSEEERFRSKR